MGFCGAVLIFKTLLFIIVLENIFKVEELR